MNGARSHQDGVDGLALDRGMDAHGPATPSPAGTSPPVRLLLNGFGAAMVGLSGVGVVLPGLPTVPFLLLAAWAFARSSERCHRWLYEHRRFGPALVAWRDHRVIPPHAKVLSTVMMLASLAVVIRATDGWAPPALHALVITAVAAFIMTRPGRAPQ